VRAYWARQFELIDPQVDPQAFCPTDEGDIAVDVHQVVHALDGQLLADREVVHLYAIRDGLVARMDVIERGLVTAVSAAPTHTMSKLNAESIRLLKGLGVEGDAHLGESVQHRSRLARDPSQPNLRQVHLIHAELHDELRAGGFDVSPGRMGENVTTRGIDLLALPAGARLRLGESAVVQVAGLRNPCVQLDGIQRGLMEATLDRDQDGGLIRRAGVMGVVVAGGEVGPGDEIRVELPPEPHRALEPV
jgi:hypothetical protein